MTRKRICRLNQTKIHQTNRRKKYKQVKLLDLIRFILIIMKTEANFFPTSINEQTQGEGNMNVNPQNVTFYGGAKTSVSFEIDTPLKALSSGVSGGFPMTILTAPSSILAQTPSFRALYALQIDNRIRGWIGSVASKCCSHFHLHTQKNNMKIRDENNAAKKNQWDSIYLQVDINPNQLC